MVCFIEPPWRPLKNYKKLLSFQPFHGPKFDLKCQHLSWKNVYGNVKNDIE
jgi:hypothetical protein